RKYNFTDYWHCRIRAPVLGFPQSPSPMKRESPASPVRAFSSLPWHEVRNDLHVGPGVSRAYPLYRGVRGWLEARLWSASVHAGAIQHRLHHCLRMAAGWLLEAWKNCASVPATLARHLGLGVMCPREKTS